MAMKSSSSRQYRLYRTLYLTSLDNKSNPGEEILDILCNKEEVTVRGLLHLLESAELNGSADIVKQSLGIFFLFY